MTDQIKGVHLYNSLKNYCELVGVSFAGESILDGIVDSKKDIKPSMIPEIGKRLAIHSVIQKINAEDLLRSEIKHGIIINKDESCFVYMGDSSENSINMLDNTTKKLSPLPIKDFKKNYSGYCITLEYTELADKRIVKSGGGSLKSGELFRKTIKLISHTFSHILIATVLINILSFSLPVYILGVYDRVIPNSQYSTLYAFYIGIIFIFFVDFFIVSS